MHLKKIFPLLLLFGLSAQCSAVDLKEGEWSIETKTEIIGMPLDIPPVTVTQCLTQSDAVPAQKSQDGNPCTMTEQHIDGSTISWKIECPDSKGSGTITYHHDHFEGEIRMEPEGKMEILSHMKGQYIGPCKE